MPPFGEFAADRPIGTVFSDQDRHVLGTLYHPFSVRFGYAKEDSGGFRENLDDIRPRLNDMFDFEKVLAEQSKIDPEAFKQSASFRLLHGALLDRWRVLDEFNDYPGMLAPLEILED